jgi:3-dehydroquinate synthase
VTIVKVEIKDRTYDIIVKANILAEAGTYLAPYARNNKMLVVTDDVVAQHVLPILSAGCADAGISLIHYALPSGEGAKSWSNLEKLTDWLLSNEVERSDHIIALGGGVVGDITGFAAHIVKRGCGFIQIPTTLLSQVDSSVGGKTAINSKAGKNLIGAFAQPALVLIDPIVLQTLPPRELGAGLAEVIKYGLINDPEFVAYCRENLDGFYAGDLKIRENMILHSVRAKAAIVAMDERETTGVRALLNLGHTFGHAFEADTGFSNKLLHGESVAAGMALAFHYSARMGYCSADEANQVQSLLRLAHLPTTLTEAHVRGSGTELVAHMLHDKKRASGNLPFLLAHGIGKVFLCTDVDLADVAQFLDTDTAKG